MDITPDTKDWTWVLERRCPECGFDSRAIAPTEVAGIVRANVDAWEAPLASADAQDRPAPGVWSPTEYACHVRDVFRLYDERLTLMLDRDDPTYPNWDQDETALEQRYDQQDPAVVIDELRVAGEQIAASFDAIGSDQWQRTGRRSDGAQFTVDTFARYFVHDIVHHIHDVTSTR